MIEKRWRSRKLLILAFVLPTSDECGRHSKRRARVEDFLIFRVTVNISSLIDILTRISETLAISTKETAGVAAI
jgi:hypothetical protein